MKEPFPVAVYYSTHKPNSLDDYAKDFIVEIKELEMVGFTSDVFKKTFKIKLGAIVWDAPAQTFVNCINTHRGYDVKEVSSMDNGSVKSFFPTYWHHFGLMTVFPVHKMPVTM